MDSLALTESLYAAAVAAGDREAADALEEGLRLFGRGGKPIDFNPNQHPRDALGKFAGVVGSLQVGHSVRLPGGTVVSRTHKGLRVRRKLALTNDPGGRYASPQEAARAALRLDPTPRENTRIGGKPYKKGAPIPRYEVAKLPKGTPVVTGAGEYGRFVDTRSPGDVRKSKMALVRFDDPDPTSPGFVTKLVDPATLRRAVPDAKEAEGSHAAPAPASPGRMQILAPAIAGVTIGPALDALHFLHDLGDISATQADRIAKGGVTPAEQRAVMARLEREIADTRRELDRDRVRGPAPRSPGRPGGKPSKAGDARTRLRKLMILKRHLAVATHAAA